MLAKAGQTPIAENAAGLSTEPVMSVTDAHISQHRSAYGRQNSLFADLADFWHNLLNTMFSHYHPERHYMRGPGPACAAKRADH